MKRLLLVLALVCLAAAAFASDVSVGVGVSGSYFSSDLKLTDAGLDGDILVTGIPLHITAFVDAKYLQVEVGYRMVDGFHVKFTPPSGSSTESDDNSKYSYVSFAGYGKLPLRLGAITLIPTVGVEYDLTIAATDDSGTDWGSQKSDLNSLWIKAGLGAEIPVSPTFYIRPELLVGYQLNNESDRDTISFYKNEGFDEASIITLNFELAVLFGVRL